jgi:hypothetical protein
MYANGISCHICYKPNYLPSAVWLGAADKQAVDELPTYTVLTRTLDRVMFTDKVRVRPAASR